MPRTRLALCACTGPAEGPWLRSRGNETGVRVQGLKAGERIISRLDIAGVIQPTVILDRDGTWPLPESWNRISFAKECLGETEMGPTQVELLVA
jgi:hypothetical protein